MSVLLDPVADGRTLVLHLARPYCCRADGDGFFGRVVERQVRGNIIEVDREQRRREIHRNPLGERLNRRRWTPEVNLDVGIEQRPEEPETLQVVKMEMAEQDVQLRARSRLQQDAQWPYPGARVEHQYLSAGKPHLNARRVAAVLDGIRAGRGDRAAASPHPRQHQASSSSSAHFPEHRDDAVHLGGRSEQWICRGVHETLHAVVAGRGERPVGGATFEEGDPGGRVPPTKRLVVRSP